jgi:hypothetical protein
MVETKIVTLEITKICRSDSDILTHDAREAEKILKAILNLDDVKITTVKTFVHEEVL